MSISDSERVIQHRVVALFRNQLGYKYYGNWQDRANNSNIEPDYLRNWLQQQGNDEQLITKAMRQLTQAATIGDGRQLYDANKAVYALLRYGVKVSYQGETTKTLWLIDWQTPQNNEFAIAEEVTVSGTNTKRPDIVIYINGIAIAVLELKRATVNVTEGIRQNLDNQTHAFIAKFFSCMQLIMAGNDSQGIYYGAIGTPEKHYYHWREQQLNATTQQNKYLTIDDTTHTNQLDFELINLCNKARLLELIHDFVVFDSGIKKLCRHNQYFGVKAAQQYVNKQQGGIIWHTQGSGKSLTMVWLAKWLREHQHNPRVLVITDRTELDEQIEAVFHGVDEQIYRSKSGADLVDKLNTTKDWLLCALVHKFSRTGDNFDEGANNLIQALTAKLPQNFSAKGNIFVFVDECHRTQSGKLHSAMKEILPNAIFIGFTGTPLFKQDKAKSIEVFGGFIHTYKFDEAVADGVVLDLLYEARDIDQYISSPEKVDAWFAAKTGGLNAATQLKIKQKWVNMQKLLSSKDRLQQIVKDILLDMNTKPRLMANGKGNAMLVCSGIYEACKTYELFSKTELQGKCAVVTSYLPSINDIKGEDSGTGTSEKRYQYEAYQKMLADYFNLPKDKAINKAEEFERLVKNDFKTKPQSMRLLIVVDKLLTGFDAPSATYLYIDKNMQDHGLFQAICRVNRLDGDEKPHGYIIDYKDLFKRLTSSINDYTGGAFENFDPEDITGIIQDRLEKAKQQLEQALESIKALCEPVREPRNLIDYMRYFCGDSSNKDDLANNEPKRLLLYKTTASLVRAYASVANEMTQAGFSSEQAASIKQDANHFSEICAAIKQASGDAIDLKQYEPAMRQLFDAYIKAEDSKKLIDFENITLTELVNQQTQQNPPESTNKAKQQGVAETIENNIRKVISENQQNNPEYYAKISALLDALIAKRRQQAIDYQQYLVAIKQLSDELTSSNKAGYPATINTPAKQALYDNLNNNVELALKVDRAVYENKKADWKTNNFKIRAVTQAVTEVLTATNATADINTLMELIKNQAEYD